MGLFTTIEDSRPEFAPPGAPADMDSWACQHWKQYHDNLEQEFGNETARSIVMGDYANVGWFATATSCKYDCDWSAYMESKGYDASSLLSNVKCGVESAAGGIEGVGETIGNIGDFASIITNTGFLVSVGAVVGSIYLYKWYEES